MTCDKCGKNGANVHVSQMVNGMKYEQHLCQECAQQLMGGASLFSGLSMNDLFRDFYQMSMAGIPAGQPQAGEANAPDDCSHLEALGLTLPALEAEHDTEVSERARLEAEMKEAVANEAYERAAQIKNKLRELDGK
ncbi:MAG: UvrB/UvrC motif-containing protein [Christensenellaceae bacterium]|jgi:protein-arginine kinase activator protein McsA